MEALKREMRQANISGRRFKYDLSFMRMVVRQYLGSSLSWVEQSQRHHVSVGQLKRWVKRFSSDIEEPIAIPHILTEEESQDLAVLKNQNEALAQKLLEAQMKITGLELMIDIAKEQHHIDLRKKPGTK